MSAVTDAVAELAKAATTSARSAFREAAIATGELPIYATVASVYVLTRGLDIVLFEPETRTVAPADDKWRRLIFIRGRPTASQSISPGAGTPRIRL